MPELCQNLNPKLKTNLNLSHLSTHALPILYSLLSRALVSDSIGLGVGSWKVETVVEKWLESLRGRLPVPSVVLSGKMPIKYLFLVNKQGQTRISKYYENVTVENRVAIEADIIRKCLGRNDTQVRLHAF